MVGERGRFIAVRPIFFGTVIASSLTVCVGKLELCSSDDLTCGLQNVLNPSD